MRELAALQKRIAELETLAITSVATAFGDDDRAGSSIAELKAQLADMEEDRDGLQITSGEQRAQVSQRGR